MPTALDNTGTFNLLQEAWSGFWWINANEVNTPEYVPAAAGASPIIYQAPFSTQGHTFLFSHTTTITFDFDSKRIDYSIEVTFRGGVVKVSKSGTGTNVVSIPLHN